jgi:tRNA pseudouridine13 synthase
MIFDASIASFADRLAFPAAYPLLNLSASFRTIPEDFMVNEDLGFVPSGSGEHWLLHIEKMGQNTHWVAEQLALFCGLEPSAVGVCGRKDRHAVTRQWFSLYAPKQTTMNWSEFVVEGVQILEVHRHSQKLRLGSHKANDFSIRLRDLTANDRPLMNADKAHLEAVIYQRLASGVPNYFGEQRFGRDNSNLVAARHWFELGRKPHPKRRSMVMSAARAYLFNQILALRVRQENWRQSMPGDLLEGGFPTGPLWGRGRSQTNDACLALETAVMADYADWCRGLEHCGLKQERRSLVLLPKNFALSWLGDDMALSFSLPVGTFATTILAEISELRVLSPTAAELL